MAVSFVHLMSLAMPYEKITLGPAYAVRLRDLQASDVLKTRCSCCDAEWSVPPHRLFAKYRKHTTIKEIAFFFVCTKCRSQTCYWHVERGFHERDRIAEEAS
ncbi:hypothetical protein [Phaeobacter piscinae]|uniref:hypothetical protein n=1 Tax=Phaeobacter piscinae TaxID=1580596 RepID=UPI001C302469|nr:hypothetical protein [Phaeobacter piscinae]